MVAFKLMLGVSHVVEVLVLGLLVVVKDSRATRDNQIYTHRKSTHTLGNGDTTQQPARDSEGELAAAAAAPPPLLMLLCCCCFPTRDASRSTTRLNRLFLVLCFLERTQERLTAQQQQQQ